MSKEAIPLKTYISLRRVSITFRCRFFRHLPHRHLPPPPPTTHNAPRVLSEHNLKSAGRFLRHCVRFLWRHKTLIDIKPRGYFNFLRLHPSRPRPTADRSSARPFTAHRLVLYGSPKMNMNCNPRPPPPPRHQRRPVIRCPFLSHAQYNIRRRLVRLFFFFRFSDIHSNPLPRAAEAVTVENRFSRVAQSWLLPSSDDDLINVRQLQRLQRRCLI